MSSPHPGPLTLTCACVHHCICRSRPGVHAAAPASRARVSPRTANSRPRVGAAVRSRYSSARRIGESWQHVFALKNLERRIVHTNRLGARRPSRLLRLGQRERARRCEPTGKSYAQVAPHENAATPIRSPSSLTAHSACPSAPMKLPACAARAPRRGRGTDSQSKL